MNPEKKRKNCWSCWWSPLLLLCVYQRQRHPDMEKYILTFVRGSGSVWVHLSTILRVQVRFRFTEVKFCWFRFGSGSPKWNGSFGFTVRVQVRFDTLPLRLQLIICHKKELLSSLSSIKLVLIRTKCYQCKLVCTGTIIEWCKMLTIKTFTEGNRTWRKLV